MNSSVSMSGLPVPAVLIRHLSSFLDIESAFKLASSNKDLNRILKEELKTKMRHIIFKNLIGPKNWNTVLELEIEESIPPEPMIEYMMTQCSFEKKSVKKVLQTHRAIYIPPNLTLDQLRKISSERWCHYTEEEEEEEEVRKTGYWVLVRKRATPEKEVKEPYCVASVIETITYLVMSNIFFHWKNTDILHFEARSAESSTNKRLFHIIFDNWSTSGHWIRGLSSSEKFNLSILRRF